MEFDLSDWIKPIIVFVACIFAVLVVFCMNALPQFAASDEDNSKRPIVYIVWTIIISVGIFGLLALFYILKHKR